MRAAPRPVRPLRRAQIGQDQIYRIDGVDRRRPSGFIVPVEADVRVTGCGSNRDATSAKQFDHAPSGLTGRARHQDCAFVHRFRPIHAGSTWLSAIGSW